MEINKIYNEDCMETMARMPDNFIDLTITSPPYDNLRKYKGIEWGDHIWKPIIQELYRVTKKGGVVVWIVGDATIKGSETGTSFRQALWAMEVGFRLHDTMIYHKKSGVPLNHNRYEPEYEYMFIFSKGRPETFNPIRIPCKWYKKDSDRTGQKWQRHDEKNKRLRSGHKRTNIKPTKIKGNIWGYCTGWGHTSLDKMAFSHSAIFPEALANDHIISWSSLDDLIYDPFLGSGTTAKMAIINGRNYIGSEISSEYCQIAEERIAGLLADG